MIDRGAPGRAGTLPISVGRIDDLGRGVSEQPRRPATASPRPGGVDRRTILAIAGVGVAVSIASAADETLSRAAIGFFGFAVFLMIALSARRLALQLVLVYLVLLGFIRRFLIPFVGWSFFDPLLLVGPAAALTFVLTDDETPPRRTVVSATGSFLLVWSIVEILNPSEPDVWQALQSMLFYAGPLLWLFVGRRLSRDEHEMVMRTVLGMGVLVVLHGLYHSFVGLLSFELTWVGVSRQSEAIFLSGFKIRPFSTLVSPQEYGFFLAFLLMVLWSRLLHRIGPRGWQTVYALVTMTALFLQATRSVFLLVLLALLVTAVAYFRSMLLLVVAVFFAGLLVAFAAATEASVAPTDEDDKATGASADAAIEHQISGLLDPSSSTAPEHIELIRDGIERGFENPFGLGPTFGNNVGARIAGAQEEEFVSAENDVGNTFSGLGLPGGVALVLLIVTGLQAARRLYRADRDWLHLAWLGILVAGLSQWLNGALYTTSAILFLVLGGASQAAHRLATRDDPELVEA